VSELSILYRSTASENRKDRPPYYSKSLCLYSFLRAFTRVRQYATVTFINDGPLPEERQAVMHEWGSIVTLPGIGNSHSYRRALATAVALPVNSLVYLAEDDYLYTEDAFIQLREVFAALPHVDYVTLFDNIDRYIRSDDSRRGYSRVFIAGGLHWRTVESACMTFGARTARLKRDAWIHRLGSLSRSPADRLIWRCTLGEKWFFWKFPKRLLVGPLPSLATHMLTNALAPNVDWEQVAAATAKWWNEHHAREDQTA
jgi:hypothetical protein